MAETPEHLGAMFPTLNDAQIQRLASFFERQRDAAGRIRPGWIERFGWRAKIDKGTDERNFARVSEPGAIATGFFGKPTGLLFCRFSIFFGLRLRT